MNPIRAGLSILVFGLLAHSAANAHYHILLPQTASGEREQPIAITLMWGHPFEHQLFDAARPSKILACEPDGKKTDLSTTLEKTTITEADKKVTAFRTAYAPKQRGDFTFVAVCDPLWMEEEKEYWQDIVKVVYHVQTQKGWDAPAGLDFEFVPLTRPYGLQPGMVFQAQALVGGKPLGGAKVEVERFNPVVPKELPKEEQITRVVKTDPNGVATCTLTEAGWWCLTVQRDAGMQERDGKRFPLRQRATFWVYVDAKESNKR